MTSAGNNPLSDLDAAPIALWLGFSIDRNDPALFRLAFNETHIGNPAIRSIHGGVIATFLEFSMQRSFAAGIGRAVRASTLSIEYLSSSRPEDMTARVANLKSGRRLAFLEARGWQEDGKRLVAVARAAFTLG